MKKPEQCSHVTRVNPHPTLKLRMGGFSLGRCENDVIPGMTVCHEHATKEALVYYVTRLLKQIDEKKTDERAQS